MSNLLGSNNAEESTSEPPIIEPSTPWVAAGDGDLPLFQTALSKLQLKIDAADENGFTFYHAAAAYNRVHVLRWLFDESRRFLFKEHEKDVCSSERQNFANAVDSDGDTPLHHCDNIEAARVLVEEGNADHTITNKEGKTALLCKQEELKQSEDYDHDTDDEADVDALKEMVEYLESLN